MAFEGFPPRVRYTPVPSPLFGPLLEQIDDLAELKCTLRVIWMLHRKRGYPRFVALHELLADRILATALAGDGASHRAKVERALDRAVARRTLVTGSVGKTADGGRVYMLNTESDRRALAGMDAVEVPTDPMQGPQPSDAAVERPNIFALYEDNIGMLSPIIADELRQAEELYAESWIKDAFREAVGYNRRSWRYIARILERWEREGRSDGESGGHPKKGGYYKEYLRR